MESNRNPVMKYSVIVHKENNSEFGVTVPDIPGCFTCGETLDEALKNLQDAVECYYEGEGVCAPKASNIETLMNNQDFFMPGGYRCRWASAGAVIKTAKRKTSKKRYFFGKIIKENNNGHSKLSRWPDKKIAGPGIRF
jgi:predicted RNase H-like HicB family nuclease